MAQASPARDEVPKLANFMKTKKQYHEITMDTVPLIESLKRIERRPRITRLGEWMAEAIRKELAWRAARAMV
jgi:hypothetical protein